VTLRFASGSVVVALGVVLCCVAGNSTVAALASVTFSIRLRRHARTLPDGTPTQIAGRPAVADDIVTRLYAYDCDGYEAAELIEQLRAEVTAIRAERDCAQIQAAHLAQRLVTEARLHGGPP